MNVAFSFGRQLNPSSGRARAGCPLRSNTRYMTAPRIPGKWSSMETRVLVEKTYSRRSRGKEHAHVVSIQCLGGFCRTAKVDFSKALGELRTSGLVSIQYPNGVVPLQKLAGEAATYKSASAGDDYLRLSFRCKVPCNPLLNRRHARDCSRQGGWPSLS